MLDWVFSVIVVWLPFILCIGAMWWCVGTVKKRLTTKDGRSIASVVDELCSQIKRSNPAP